MAQPCPTKGAAWGEDSATDPRANCDTLVGVKEDVKLPHTPRGIEHGRTERLQPGQQKLVPGPPPHTPPDAPRVLTSCQSREARRPPGACPPGA